jgi:hypothetical protein
MGYPMQVMHVKLNLVYLAPDHLTIRQVSNALKLALCGNLSESVVVGDTAVEMQDFHLTVTQRKKEQLSEDSDWER